MMRAVQTWALAEGESVEGTLASITVMASTIE
jgi:hypothetical protein